MPTRVTYTDWNSYGDYYPDMDASDKKEYMVGAQANGYLKWFKSNLSKWYNEMDQLNDDIEIEEATGYIKMWKGQEFAERTAMIGRLCEELDVEQIDMLPNESGRVGMPAAIMDSLEFGERRGLQKIGSKVDFCMNIFVTLSDQIGQHRKRGQGNNNGYVVDPSWLANRLEEETQMMHQECKTFYEKFAFD